MLFGSVTRGYQAGGFNSVSTQANGGRFDPETITSYELGAKGRMAGAGITYSASLFHYLFKNLQSITLNNAGTVAVYNITVSDVEATGLDAELNWQVAAPMRLYANGEWIDQKYKAQKNVAPGRATTSPASPTARRACRWRRASTSRWRWPEARPTGRCRAATRAPRAATTTRSRRAAA